MDQSSLLQEEDYIGYMFSPVEYRAVLSSYQKVSQILKSNPYVNDEMSIGGKKINTLR